MNFDQLITYLHDNEVPISAFYWCMKWALDPNEKFGIDIGKVKIIYEGFSNPEYRRNSEGNDRELHLCIIFYFEKFDLNIKLDFQKSSGWCYDLQFPYDWLYNLCEVKISKRVIRTYTEDSSLRT